MVAHRGQEVVKPAGRLAQNTLAAFDWSVRLGLTTGADKAATGRRESGNQQKSAAFRDEGGGGVPRGLKAVTLSKQLWRENEAI